jgi:hypothetical protein
MTNEVEQETIITALAEAQLSIEVEKFLDTDIGRYILGCREQDEKDALEKLVEFDPYKYNNLGELQTAFAKIQENVLIARKVHGYLSDAIIRGNQAEEILAAIED